MFLKGDNISIRALEPTDAVLLYQWENNQTLWEVSNTQTPFSKAVLDEFVNTAYQDIYTNKQLRLMVCKADNNETIGVIDLFEFDPQHARCGLGIYINEKYRGNGFAVECIQLIKTYVFFTLHLKQIYVHVNQSNEASLSLFEKAGFEKSGLKKSWHKNGINSYEDVWFLQLINKGE
ncbi:MAG: GNAT family N-acetyltransferase [Bacteroidota bacterium]|nr:GNAT family N-acetyltransferase [Bacteroidota bacterium]MDP3145620.1 GNAT family N-acetyltransferase [Bacteroidota bacterium]MDP3558707.1 GNAT family N-acetyltransferase [Bacteroidota bacterium]